MSFVKKWLGIKKPKKIKLADVQKQQQSRRMSMTPQKAALDARFMQEDLLDKQQNRTQLTNLGGGGSKFT